MLRRCLAKVTERGFQCTALVFVQHFAVRQFSHAHQTLRNISMRRWQSLSIPIGSVKSLSRFAPMTMGMNSAPRFRRLTWVRIGVGFLQVERTGQTPEVLLNRDRESAGLRINADVI
jgi:hypothetical protein